MSHTINTQVIENQIQKFNEAGNDLADMREIMLETDALGFTKEAEDMGHMLDHLIDKASDDRDMAMDYYHGNA